MACPGGALAGNGQTVDAGGRRGTDHGDSHRDDGQGRQNLSSRTTVRRVVGIGTQAMQYVRQTGAGGGSQTRGNMYLLHSTHSRYAFCPPDDMGAVRAYYPQG